MAMTPEGAVKAAVKKYLTAKGAWFFLPVSNGMGSMGIPDFVCGLPPNGRLLVVECKAKGRIKNTSELQKMQLARVAGVGGLAVVVDDVSKLEEYLCQQGFM